MIRTFVLSLLFVLVGVEAHSQTIAPSAVHRAFSLNHASDAVRDMVLAYAEEEEGDQGRMLPGRTHTGRVQGGGGGASPSTDHPRLGLTNSGVSPTLSALQTRYAPGTGDQATDYQAELDLLCKTTASGGTYGATPNASGDPWYDSWYANDAVIHYAWMVVTNKGTPIAGLNFRDGCVNLTGLQNRFLAYFDYAFNTTTNCPAGVSQRIGLYAMFAYDWGFDVLDSTRKATAVQCMKNASSNTNVSGGLHHVEAPARLLYTITGYAFTGDGVDDGDANTRILTRSTNMTGTGSPRAMLNLVSADGAPDAGRGYTNTQLEGWQLHELLSIDAYRTSQGDPNEVATGNVKYIEYYPKWLAYHLYPYKPTPPSDSAQYQVSKSAESIDFFFGPTDFPTGTDLYEAVTLANVSRIYASSNTTMAQLAKWEISNLYYSTGHVTIASTFMWARMSIWANFLGYNTVTAQSPTQLDLPVANWFQSHGSVVIRDSWAFDGTPTWLRFVAKPYKWVNNGYDEPCHGGIAIHHGGPLLIEPGNGVHGMLQENGWQCNGMIFPKIGETRTSAIAIWDKGGPRPAGFTPTPLATTDYSLGSKYDLGALKEDATGCSGGDNGSPCAAVDLTTGTASSPRPSTHPYNYIYTDLTRGFNGPQNNDASNAQKVNHYDRTLVTFPAVTPGTDPTFIVDYVRVKTPDTTIEPRYVFFPANTSLETDKTFSVTSADSGPTAAETCGSLTLNRWAGTGGTIYGTISYAAATKTNQLAAKMFWRPLLPASLYLVEAGGPNGSNQLFVSDSHEQEDPYCVQGASAGEKASVPGTEAIPPAYGYSDSGTAYRTVEGNWRYWVRAQTTATSEQFLNVFEPTTTTGSVTSVTLLSGTNTTGVRIDDATKPSCAVFKTVANGKLGVGGNDFNLDVASKSFNCVLGHLTPNTSYSFTLGANLTSMTNNATGSTSTSQTSNADGVLNITFVTNGTSPTGAGNKVQF